MYQSGGWPWYDFGEEDELDRQTKASENYNREQLVAVLRQTGEPTIELYGVWDGDFDFSAPPVNREEIILD